MIKKIVFGLRPADALNLLFLFFLTLVVLFYRSEIDGPFRLVLLYAVLMFVQLALVNLKKKGFDSGWFYDLIFPTISILAVFDSLEGIVHSINPRDIDPLLIRLDYLMFGSYPTVVAEKFMSPILTDVLQLAYSSYYFLPLILGAALKIRKEGPAFDRSLFLIMFCFYLSYLGYMLMPALGPRYTMTHLQGEELRGLIIAGPLQEVLNRLEGIKRDAFPSGHTGVALTVLYLSRLYYRRLFFFFLPCVTALILSTVYCRYHYVVDVLGGAVLTLVTVYFGKGCYEWAKRIYPDR